jgi:hypothetical protein
MSRVEAWKMIKRRANNARSFDPGNNHRQHSDPITFSISLSCTSVAKEPRPPFDPAAGFQKDLTRIPLPN